MDYNGERRTIGRWRELDPDMPIDDRPVSEHAARDAGDPDKFTTPGYAAVLIGSTKPNKKRPRPTDAGRGLCPASGTPPLP